MRTLVLPSGDQVPVLGQGTWAMGDRGADRAREIDALARGLDLGMTLVDTAEMYGDGRSEELIAKAIVGRRNQVFLVSKVLPSHATRAGTIEACEASLRRLATDRLDLYLLHWRGSVPLAETLDGFHRLVRAGKIRYWGVSNFDKSDLEELVEHTGGSALATYQVLYNLTRRGIEFDVLPWHRSRRIPIMAYSPVEQGRLLNNRRLTTIASQLNATPSQVALAWVLRYPGVIAI